MGSRNTEKEMLKKHGALETFSKMIENTMKSSKTKSQKLITMKKELQEYFMSFDEAFRSYKADLIVKGSATLDTFNGVNGVGENNFFHNDSWCTEVMGSMLSLTETIEEKIDELESTEVTENKEKVNVIEIESITVEVKSEQDELKQTVEKFEEEISAAEKYSSSKAAALDKVADKIKKRLEQLRIKSRTVSEDLKSEVNTFCSSYSNKVDACVLTICSKLSDDAGTDSLPTSSGKVPVSSQVHLEKSKPPKFRGEETDYPEFKRKWQNIVGNANLPEESEIDKLRDSLPSDAADQLYGVTTIEKAWEILDKRFGDPKIISMKLKGQLKSIQSEGKTDPARVINLAIKVRTISTKLAALNMSGALEHDSEFLSAVFCALPDKHKTRWLDYTKSDNHWSDMMNFLERAYNQATEELALLSTYKLDKKKGKSDEERPTSKTYAAQVKKQGDTANSIEVDDSNSSKEIARKRSEEFCGKCPLCKNSHTWTRKSGDKWPSDRFLSCQKFNDLAVAARAKQIENIKGCPRCLSWNHTRDKCKMPANKCGKEDSNNVKCRGDHSKLLCGSGNAYCFAVKGSLVSESVQLEDQMGNADFSFVDENVDTVFFLQDIPVEGCAERARVFWDEGSSRVLVRDEYAEIMGFPKKRIQYSIEVVGKEVEYMSGFIYLLSLKDIYNKSHRLWGYGISRIMKSSVPDLSDLITTFPQVPRSTFKALQEREVDILIGLNMSHLMPSGGSGVDQCGGIKVKRSLFGTGWVVGGALGISKSYEKSSYKFSTQAAVVRSAKVLVMPEPSLNPDFWECDQMGVRTIAKCERCKKCQESGKCSDTHIQHTLKEQAELDLIRANTNLVNGEIWCEYPFVKDPACLSNNRDSAIKVAEKVWASLERDNLLQDYNEQVKQVLDRKAAVQ